MDSAPTSCRIRVKWPRSEASGGELVTQSLKDVKSSSRVTEQLLQQWISNLVESFSSTPTSATTVRPWDILLHEDGSVETLSSEKKQIAPSLYPSRFRIPPATIHGLDEAEQVKRAEKFALGSLLYELITANEPFEQLRDDEVQHRYDRGEFPDDVFSMAMGAYILGCWSLEFEKEMEELLSIGARIHAYAKKHPFLLAGQIAGGVGVLTSLVALPILGAAGFAAAGPVAGSAAAAWQSSMGLVQAGSLFAWCQSAAMGGAAVNGIFALGAAGGGVAAAATGVGLVDTQTALTPEKLKEMFVAVYTKEGSGEELTEYKEKST